MERINKLQKVFFVRLITNWNSYIDRVATKNYKFKAPKNLRSITINTSGNTWINIMIMIMITKITSWLCYGNLVKVSPYCCVRKYWWCLVLELKKLQKYNSFVGFIFSKNRNTVSKKNCFGLILNMSNLAQYNNFCTNVIIVSVIKTPKCLTWISLSGIPSLQVLFSNSKAEQVSYWDTHSTEHCL